MGTREFRGATRVDPVDDVRVFIRPELLLNFLVDRLPEGFLDFGVAAVRELGGVDPRLLNDVEVVDLLDGVNSFLDFGGNCIVEAGVRENGGNGSVYGGGRDARNVSDLLGFGERVERGPSGARPFLQA